MIGLNKLFKLITFFTRVSNVFIQVWKHVWINRITFSIIFHYCLIFCTHWKSLVRFVSFSSKYRSTLKRLQLTIESRMKMKFVINSWTNLVPRRKDNLHFKRAHSEKKFLCKHCTKSFFLEHWLEDHIWYYLKKKRKGKAKYVLMKWKLEM